MKNHFVAALIAVAAIVPAGLAAPALAAQEHRDGDQYDNGDRGDNGRGHGYGHDRNRGNNRGYDNRWQGDQNGNWEPSQHYRQGNYRARAMGRNDHIYRGQDGRSYCRRSDGTTGLVIGAIGGGVLGNVVGGGTLGTLLGAGGGALLGRSIDRGKIQCR